MNIETVVKETIKELDTRRNYLRLRGELDSDLKTFYREQCLNYLLLSQQSILDWINEGNDEIVKGEFDFISECIRIRQRITVEPVSHYNAKCKSEYEKFKYNHKERKTGFVASSPSFICWDMSVGSKRIIFAKTKTEAIANLKKEMYRNSEYYGV